MAWRAKGPIRCQYPGCDVMFTPTGPKAKYCALCRNDPAKRERRRVESAERAQARARQVRRNPMTTRSEDGRLLVACPLPHGPEAYRQLAHELGMSASRLIALGRQNDPFYGPQPAQRRDAEWFKDLWDGLRFDTAHLRRVQYALLSTQGITDPLGRPYANNDNSWGLLCNGAKWARYMGLIPPLVISDARNEDLRENIFPRDVEPEPGVSLEGSSWNIPQVQIDLPTLEMPGVLVDGYDYEPADQSVVQSVWVEKSTQNDIVIPLCRRLDTNLLVGTGFESITRAVELVKRAQAWGKRVDILYISDYDPQGRAMPLHIARQVQFWAEQELEEEVPQITVQALVLTREQIERYDLPPMFDRHEEGAVELDALEGLHPGALAQIITEAVQRRRDEMLEARLEDAEETAAEEAEGAWEDRHDDLDARLDTIRELMSETRARHQAAVDEINADLGVLRGELAALRTEAADRFRDVAAEITLPERPAPRSGAITVKDGDLLFDSNRSWVDNQNAFNRHKERVGLRDEDE